MSGRPIDGSWTPSGIRGESGEVRWGYHVAMQIATWSFVGTGSEGGSFTASVVTHDTFRIGQRPLTLVLQLRDGQVRWPVRGLTFQGAQVVIDVGPRERKN